MSSRWMAPLSALFVACVLFALAGPGIAGAATGCTPHCGGEYPSLQRSGNPEPVSCMHDPGCGGGGALVNGSTAGLAVMAGVAASIGAVLATWRRRRVWSRQPLGVLLAWTLFRPPRLLLDV